MNERIKLLVKQSTTIEVINGRYIDRFDNEKFANLIMKECIKDCRDMFIIGSVSWNLLNKKLEHLK